MAALDVAEKGGGCGTARDAANMAGLAAGPVAMGSGHGKQVSRSSALPAAGRVGIDGRTAEGGHCGVARRFGAMKRAGTRGSADQFTQCGKSRGGL